MVVMNCLQVKSLESTRNTNSDTYTLTHTFSHAHTQDTHNHTYTLRHTHIIIHKNTQTLRHTHMHIITHKHTHTHKHPQTHTFLHCTPTSEMTLCVREGQFLQTPRKNVPTDSWKTFYYITSVTDAAERCK